MAERDLLLGVIGAGKRGNLAACAHQPGRGSRIAACCDVNPGAFANWRERAGADLYTTPDVRELLARPLDAVFICSPDHLHEEHAVAALEAGKAVYLEKPMAITIAGCDRILDAARRTGTRLFVGHNMRYMGIIRKMKALIDAGAVGEVKSVWCRHFISYGGDAYFRDWHAERKNSTGLLLQKGAHDLDVIHWLCGARTTRVSAFGALSVYDRLPRRDPADSPNVAFNPAHWPPRSQSGFNPVIDVEDQNVVIMQMERGILGAYLQCHFTPDCCRNYTVIGTDGRLENLGDEPDSPIAVWNRRTDKYRLIPDEVHRAEAPADGTHGGSDPLIVEEFLRYVRSGGPTTATPEAARMAVAVGCQATASLRGGGQPLDIPPLPFPETSATQETRS